MTHTIDGDMWHFTDDDDVCLSWVLGTFWVARSLSQRWRVFTEMTRDEA
jgi:hypothetical protein